MHVSYCLGWLRTEENNYLSLSLDRVRTLSRQAQTLLGYAAHDGLAMGLGYLGARNLQELRSKARYIRVTAAGMRESAPHDIVEVKAAI